ncbi:MAG: ankyrin repeat domain-containing protein, partial [Legionellales bacterium]|nr:ankyrin repeat domain-containing protein [Legionellales bacterium]
MNIRHVLIICFLIVNLNAFGTFQDFKDAAKDGTFVSKFDEIVLQNNDDFNALAWALRWVCYNDGMDEILDKLINHTQFPNFKDLPSKKGRTAISLAAEKGYTAKVKRLLDNGCSSIIPDEKGAMPLNYAFKNKKKDVAELLTSSNNPICKEQYDKVRDQYMPSGFTSDLSKET